MVYRKTLASENAVSGILGAYFVRYKAITRFWFDQLWVRSLRSPIFC
ncbi:hypothetical protein L1F28_08720 [Arthrospira platensis NCB002]|nr:hypothetical protein [Arthrospira platensis NCB002]